ncbi:MAG: DNA-directed RNA polymerase subunit beta', partial [Thermodesulfobacteriota bacterium]
AGVERVVVRSVLTCLSEDGTCSNCYGSDLSTGRLIEVGSTVGIIAAQAVGSATTQYVLDARKQDKYPAIWLKEVIDLFEAREPKGKALLNKFDGHIEEIDLANGSLTISTIHGTKALKIPRGRKVVIKEGQHVKVGDVLTDGRIDPNELINLVGIRDAQLFLLSELQRLYKREGVSINDKHFEVIIRKMTDKVRIENGGNTFFLKEDLVTRRELFEENAAVSMEVEGGKEAIGKPVLLGVSKAALDDSSFIAAAAFQETTKVLTRAALAGEVDNLKGLSENIIMGRLIPAGTGLNEYRNLSFKEIS